MVHRVMLVGALLVLGMEGSGIGGEQDALELLCPADKTTVTFTAALRPPVTFSWRGAPGRPTYRLRVARARDFDRPIVDRMTAGTSEAVHALGPGRYYWKVTAADASSSIGSFRLK